jgi:hypothetical protein
MPSRRSPTSPPPSAISSTPSSLSILRL